MRGMGQGSHGVLFTTTLIALVAILGMPGAATARDTTVDGEYLLRFEPGTSRAERETAVERHGGRITGRIGALGVYTIEVAKAKAEGRTDAEARRDAGAFAADSDVRRAEPNFVYSAFFTPNDPGFVQQYAWNLINAPIAWDTTQGSATVKIANVGTGVDDTHPDLDAKLLPGYDWVDDDTGTDDGNGHGTHVAGTSAAETNNATGGAGMCPACMILPLRVLNNTGTGTAEDIASAIVYAANNGAQVINLSLGGPGSATLGSAIDYAAAMGSFLACAAGNDNTSATTNAYPAAYDNCFAVASTTSSDVRSSFSNFGSWVEVAAPGSSIYSTYLGSTYNTLSGTSMATPHVSGLAGLLASQGLTSAQIAYQICGTAANITGTGTFWTCGRIDAGMAVSTPYPQVAVAQVSSPVAARPEHLWLRAGLRGGGLVTASGHVRITGRRGVLKLRGAARRLRPDQAGYLKPRLARGDLRRVRRALKAGRRVTAVVRVRATNRYGATSRETKRIRLVLPGSGGARR